jgi:probable phosphoglycerate mutase
MEIRGPGECAYENLSMPCCDDYTSAAAAVRCRDLHAMSPRATTILLIRHAMTNAVGARLTGRAPGVSLSPEGAAQAERLREHLRDVSIEAIYSSPMERAIATALPLARERGLAVQTLDGLNEVDFGDWTGLTFSQLDRLPEWRRFNRERGSAPVPNGERAADVQRRVIGTLAALAARHRGGTIAAVSHADVIRNAVLFATATPLDLWQRFEISPASITVVDYEHAMPRVLTVDQRPHLAAAL